VHGGHVAYDWPKRQANRGGGYRVVGCAAISGVCEGKGESKHILRPNAKVEGAAVRYHKLLYQLRLQLRVGAYQETGVVGLRGGAGPWG
jgi:hypothetical protein